MAAFGGKAHDVFAPLLVLLCLCLPASAGPSLLVETATSKVILQHRSGEPWYPASLTKLMTAYLTFKALREGRLKPDQEILISWQAAMQPPSKIGIPPGGTITVDLALQALLVYSANDIAVALAEAVSGNLPSFVVEMNKTARAFDMTGTRFLNPHGLHDPNHVSTARDMALLALRVHSGFPEHRHYFKQDHVALGKRKLLNRNALLRLMREADGMKTGFVCAAGFNLAATATVNGKHLLAVVLGAANSRSRAQWAQHLLELGASGGGANVTVAEIANATGEQQAPDLSEAVCGGRRGLDLKPATALSGHGVSLGRFAQREEGLRVLRLWSDAGDSYLDNASEGLFRLGPSKAYAAMVWDLDEGEARSLCAFLKERRSSCEVMRPEQLQTMAEQARAEAKRPVKKRSGKGKKRKKG
ncbi:MAG TPA: D-alanyl-D-alanine carboxypeptidase family protein [Aestuariivirgaceae bacterium]|jgi:D-alanyl-D-alanine carboxypeptidase